MKRLLIIPILLIAGIVKGYSQTDTTKGIFFENNLSWSDILQKAKVEHKYIFVDCYTTWCGPCKAMDKNVYSKDTVGGLMNIQFICVKLQMDTAKADDQVVQSRYATAHAIGNEYSINAYPTYLFFSPDGQAVHKEIGYKNIHDFLVMGSLAMDPQQQYYRLLSQFRNGDRNYATMPYLARAARNVKEDSLALRIAADYMQHYLLSLGEGQLWTKENVSFIGSFGKALHSNGQLFILYLRDKKKIDSIMGEPGYSDRLINNMVNREVIKPETDAGVAGHFEPNWRKMNKKIGHQYGKEYVERNVVGGQVEFYRTTKAWPKYAKSFIRQMEFSGIDDWKPASRTAMALNNDAFEVFKYSKDRKELEKALIWIDRAISMEPEPKSEELDTKANLLYKLGKKDQGLVLEERSHNLNPQDKEIVESFNKMKNGLPTWPTE